MNYKGHVIKFTLGMYFIYANEQNAKLGYYAIAGLHSLASARRFIDEEEKKSPGKTKREE